MQLVVFSSFECPACKIFWEYLHQAMTDRFPGRLNVVFKHFPLGKACNSMVDEDKYPHACEAAWAAEAARQEGAFWQFHDAMLQAGFSGPDPVGRAAQAIGLPAARFDELREDEATRSKVREDIELGNQLGIQGTPTIFINGRRIKHMNLRAIDLVLTSIVNVPQIEQVIPGDSPALSK